jgi:hypothetical protein
MPEPQAEGRNKRMKGGKPYRQVSSFKAVIFKAPTLHLLGNNLLT